MSVDAPRLQPQGVAVQNKLLHRSVVQLSTAAQQKSKRAPCLWLKSFTPHAAHARGSFRTTEAAVAKDTHPPPQDGIRSSPAVFGAESSADADEPASYPRNTYHDDDADDP